jgi:hypothetical protein
VVVRLVSTPKIHGLLAWYDESPSFLAAAVASFAPVCETITAVDGAYALFPDARARSLPIQAQVIQDTCDALGIGCTIHRPAEPFFGNEVEKRTLLFRLGAAVAETHRDWFWVFDADCVLTEYPSDLHDQLAECPTPAAEVLLWERRDYLGDHPEAARELSFPTAGASRMRMLFKAHDKLQAVGAHYIYGGFDVHGDWEYLWGPRRIGTCEAATFESVRVEHRSIWRDKYRREAAQTYYEMRNELGVERLTTDDGTGQLVVEAKP